MGQRVSHLKVFLLGSPRLERDGHPLGVDTRKALALLAYLVLNRAHYSRDALANLLWSEYAQSNARAALRRTLSVLNSALGGDCLEIDRDEIGVAPNARLWVDVDEFHRTLSDCQHHGHSSSDICADCIALLKQAAALYRDDFLAGFTLRDSPNFDEWQFFQTETLRREFAGVLEKLVRHHSAQKEYEAAITHARRWLALDPLHEPAHRALMQLYAASGQRAAALRQYRECVRVLGEGLGVAPLEETTRLYEEMKSSSGGAREQGRVGEKTPLRPISPAPLPSPLVGRSAEVAALTHAYDTARDAHLIVIEGEAGIGKTRLAEELILNAQAQGALLISARCYEGEAHLAFAPFVQALRAAFQVRAGELQHLPAPLLAEAARLLPEIATMRSDLPAAPPLDNPGAQGRFFESIVQVLLVLFVGRTTGVFFIDDLHWADEASLDLLTYLVRRMLGRPLVFLTTWRSEQVPRGHRLRHLLADAEREKRATALNLTRLKPTDVKEWICLLGQSIPHEIDEQLYRETEGIPFFIAEYLAAISAQKGQVKIDWAIPHGVRHLIHSRLASVGGLGIQLMTAASVIGRSFDLETLREVSGRGEEETVTALEMLISQGLVREEGTSPVAPSYDFTHEKFRALVYEETTLARRRLLHRRTAEAFSRARGDTEARASLIAQHYRAAGREREAAEYFKLAGNHARKLFANAEAVSHYRAALALDFPDTAELHENIGDLQTLLGEYRAAITSYETAAALGDSSSLARLEHKLGKVYQRRGENDLAASHFRSALAALTRDGAEAERARVYADWSLAAHQQGKMDEAHDLADRALQYAKSANDSRALAQAHNILGILARGRNELDQARVHLEASRELAESLADPSAQTAALNNLAWVHRSSGNIEIALALTEAALRLCSLQGDRHREAALRNNLADLFHTAGQSEKAMEQLKQAVAIFAEIGGEPGALQPEIWKLAEW
jgi:DNA-binding SARP family transcriptional activator/predicted ATPase